MQIELNRPANAGPYAAAQTARPRRTPGTLSRRELRRIVAEMVD
jgi:hypothetical protein